MLTHTAVEVEVDDTLTIAGVFLFGTTVQLDVSLGLRVLPCSHHSLSLIGLTREEVAAFSKHLGTNLIKLIVGSVDVRHQLGDGIQLGSLGIRDKLVQQGDISNQHRVVEVVILPAFLKFVCGTRGIVDFSTIVFKHSGVNLDIVFFGRHVSKCFLVAIEDTIGHQAHLMDVLFAHSFENFRSKLTDFLGELKSHTVAFWFTHHIGSRLIVVISRFHLGSVDIVNSTTVTQGIRILQQALFKSHRHGLSRGIGLVAFNLLHQVPLEGLDVVDEVVGFSLQSLSLFPIRTSLFRLFTILVRESGVFLINLIRKCDVCCLNTTIHCVEGIQNVFRDVHG